jgi:hypothetical protein
MMLTNVVCCFNVEMMLKKIVCGFHVNTTLRKNLYVVLKLKWLWKHIVWCFNVSMTL